VERRAAGSWFSLALLNGLTLLTVGIASHHSFLQVLETDRQKQQTQQALVNLQTLLTQMAELEVGRRGYFLTNENSQLTSYQAAIANVERTLPELKPVLSGSTQKQRFNQLSQLIDQQVKSLTTSIQTHRQTPQSSSKIGPVTHGKAHNTIRTLIIDMKGHEQKALLDATAASQTNIKTSLTLLVGGLGLSLAMSAVIFWLLNQQLVRRRLAEQDLKQANQLLRILSTCNQHLVHAREEHSFLQQVCQDVVQLGNYSLAWVSLLTTPDTLQPIASAGQPLETLAPLQPLEPMDDRSPTARAIATGQLSLEQDIDRSNSSTTWRREALAQRHRAMLALPLISDGKCLGALTIATPTTNTFSTSQITLMADLAADLAYGIKTLRTQQARQQVEAQLQQSEQRLQSILQHMPVLLNALDEQWNYIAWNQECERVTGYSAAEIIGNPNALKLLYPNPDYLRKMMAEWEVRGHNYRNWEWEFTHKNGEVHIISWSNISDTCPIPGWPVWGIGVDVTDQKKAEAQLRDSEQRLGLAIEGAGMATWDHDLRTGRSIWSPQHFWLMGYPYQSGIEGRAEDWFRQVHPQDLERIAEAKLKARQERSLYTCEYRIHRADTGEIAWFADFGRFIYDENGEATRLVGVVFDITQRKQAELALQQLNAELEQRIIAVRMCDRTYDRDGVHRGTAHDIPLQP
jgi:PAS domain S-box-containing protein